MYSKNQIVDFLYRLIGLFYVISAIAKCLAVYKIEETLMSLGFRGTILGPLAFVIIGSEFVIGLFIFFSILDKIVLHANILLLTIYTFVIVKLIVDGNTFDCGCSGTLMFFKSVAYNNYVALLRNLIMLTISLIVFQRRRVRENAADWGG
jgi:hypothetical protein